MTVRISQLFIYPIKSCGGISVSNFKFDRKGPLLDRRWMLVDSATGVFLSQREVPQMALVSTSIDDGVVFAHQFFNADLDATIGIPFVDVDSSEASSLLKNVYVWDDEVQGYDCGDDVANWFSGLLDRSCRLIYQGQCKRLASEKYADEGTEVSFADGFPLLLVSKSSMDVLNGECESAVGAENFRPNMVVEGVEAFSEEDWCELQAKQFVMKVVKPCERCVIPTINPLTSERESDILKALIKYCRKDGKIYFGQNLTFQPLFKDMLAGNKEADAVLRVGDLLEIR
jgi:uncharacterized protein YcbX